MAGMICEAVARGCPLSELPGYAATVVKMCPGLRALDGRKVGPGGWAEGGADDGRARHGDGDKEEAAKPKVAKDDTKRLQKVESDV